MTPDARTAPALDAGNTQLLAWLRSFFAGDGALGDVGDAFADAALRYRVATLARSCGARHLRLTEAERSDFIRGQQILLGSAQVVAMFDGAEIRCVTLKGPAMAARFWGDVTLRRSSDIDVLVTPRDFDAAANVLKANHCHHEDISPDWYQKRWHFHLGFVAADRSLPRIELHWSFVRPYLGRPPIADVVNGAEPVDCGTQVLPAPEPAWQLLAACVHSLSHEIELRSVLDIAFVARALGEADWARAVACARGAGLGPALYYGVQVSSRLLGWPAPASLDVLRPGSLRERIAERYLASLSPFSRVTFGARQFGKFARPLVSTEPRGLIVAMPFSFVDRPRVLARLDAAVRRIADTSRSR